MNVEVEELEDLLGPEECGPQAYPRRRRRRKKVRRYLRLSAQMVRVNSWWSAARDGTSTKENGTHHGDKTRLPLQVMDGGKRAWNGVGWNSMENRVMEAAEDYLENCANMNVDIEVLETLLKPENLEISPRYILKYSTSRGSKIFQLFDTTEKPGHGGCFAIAP